MSNSDIFSDLNFQDQDFDFRIKQNLLRNNKITMTKIQAETIPKLLAGRSLVGCAKTGSGKTFAFLIPIIDRLIRENFENSRKLGCIVICPTRELAIQISMNLGMLIKGIRLNYFNFIGGQKIFKDNQIIRRGINIAICTPGRLLDHLENNSDFIVKDLKCLIVDETDRILEVGFEETMRSIINLLPIERQTVLFSATQGDSVESFNSLCLPSDFDFIDINKKGTNRTVESIEQKFLLLDEDEKLPFLYNFISSLGRKKMIVFFSSCNSVRFHEQLFNTMGFKVYALHGKLNQSSRTNIFLNFLNSKFGYLFSTDVAARGLDIPDIDWIIQYDPPNDPKDYIHRVGRTARGQGIVGQAILVLLKYEKDYVKELNGMNVSLRLLDYDRSDFTNIQDKIFSCVKRHLWLSNLAQEALKGFFSSYSTHSLKSIFNVNNLSLSKVIKSFGFNNEDDVDLSFIQTIIYRNSHGNRRKKISNHNARSFGFSRDSSYNSYSNYSHSYGNDMGRRDRHYGSLARNQNRRGSGNDIQREEMYNKFRDIRKR